MSTIPVPTSPETSYPVQIMARETVASIYAHLSRECEAFAQRFAQRFERIGADLEGAKLRSASVRYFELAYNAAHCERGQS